MSAAGVELEGDQDAGAVLAQVDGGAGVGGTGALKGAVGQDVVKEVQVVLGGEFAGEGESVAFQNFLQGLGKGHVLGGAGGVQSDELLVKAGAVYGVIQLLHVQAVPGVRGGDSLGLEVERAGFHITAQSQVQIGQSERQVAHIRVDGQVGVKLESGLAGDHVVVPAHIHSVKSIRHGQGQRAVYPVGALAVLVGVVQILVHELVGLGVFRQNGLHVVDNDGGGLPVPGHPVAQGVGHQAHGDVGAAGGGVNIGGRVSGVVLQYLDQVSVGTGGGVPLVLDRDGIGADGQMDRQVPLCLLPLEIDIGHVGLDGGHRPGLAVPGNLVGGEAQGLKGGRHGQEGAAVLQHRGGVGEGHRLSVHQQGEIPLLRRQGRGAQQGGQHAAAQNGAQKLLHVDSSLSN